MKTSSPHQAVVTPTLLPQNKVIKSEEKVQTSEDKQQTLSQKESRQNLQQMLQTKLQRKKTKVLDLSLDTKELGNQESDNPLNFSNAHRGISEAFKQTEKPSTLSLGGKLLMDNDKKEEDMIEKVDGAEVEIEIKY